ncbi:MAG: hypothetical protein EOM92_19920, partial [Gammaproteobacteria bacterium]|nr:hypothetical protein [Gammaproteobacteria bacterium]
MRLNPARFNRFLSKIGQDLAWRPSSACPCVQPYSGSPDPSCPHCAGKGRLWAAATACSAGIVSRDIMRQAAPMAILDAGDVMLVIPSDQPIYGIGEYDRVVMTDRTEPFSLNLIAGTNALRFNPVSIDRITWLAGDGKLVDGTPPTGWANGTLTWTTPKPPAKPPTTPPAGVTVAITGRRHPEY